MRFGGIGGGLVQDVKASNKEKAESDRAKNGEKKKKRECRLESNRGG